METTKTMTQLMSQDVRALSLSAACPFLGDQVVAVQGTGVSVAGAARPVCDRAFASTSILTTPIFADGVGRSVPWRPPV